MTHRLGALLVACLMATAAEAKAPKLVVFVTVDSMGSDLFSRMKPRLKGGLSQVLTQGAYFPTVRYEQAECVTASAHATLATGASPWRHGIVGNRMLNRATGKLEPAFTDLTHPVLEAPLGNDDVSPQALLSQTVSDQLRLATVSKGKALAISAKARAAIPLAGRLGEAYWFNENTGRFVTGTHYRKEFPAWVKAFNDKKPADEYFGKSWTLLAPPAEYAGVDDRPFESDVLGLGRAFPHSLSGGGTAAGAASYAALAATPFINDLTAQFAKAALEGEGFGKDDVPDLLNVSFSGLDRVYHVYGPYSFEAQDALLRLDKALTDVIAAAEKAAGGKANLTVIVTGDHGGAALAEEWIAAGLDAARVSADALAQLIKTELLQKYKADFLLALEETDVYLDAKAMADKKVDVREVRRAVASVLSRHPRVAVAVSRDDLATESAQGFGESLRKGFHPDRSGDVVLLLKPFAVLDSEGSGTTHGTPYAYDAEVPFLLWGKSVKPGVYLSALRAVDIASTLAAILEIGNPAHAEGAACTEALTLSPK